MPATFKVSVSLSGDGGESYGGVLSVSYPEMNINKREFTFLETRPSGVLYVVVFSRDGDRLFTLARKSEKEVDIHNEEEYGKTLDGKERGGLGLMISFAGIVHHAIVIFIQKARKDSSVLQKGISFEFEPYEITDERTQEILCLMCRVVQKKEENK